MKIGYARVSSIGQSLDLQVKALKDAGCEKIFSEKVSAAKGQRKEFDSMMEFAREGDQVMATRLDRLSRSSIELQNTAKTLENKKIDLRVLEQDIDTSNPSGKLLFNMIGIVAEFERDMINERAAEGRKAAMKKGVKFGRKKVLDSSEIDDIRVMASEGIAKNDIAKKFNISRSTVYRTIDSQNITQQG